MNNPKSHSGGKGLGVLCFKVVVILACIVAISLAFSSLAANKAAKAASSGNSVNLTIVNPPATVAQLEKKAVNSVNPPATVSAQVNGLSFEFFQTTGHSLRGPLLSFYQRTGGQARHGTPLTEILNINGQYLQFFENSVFQFDPRYEGSPAVVKMLPLGSLLTASVKFPTVAPFVSSTNHWYFPETGHSLSFGFLDFWLNNGGRDTLGLPLSEEIQVKDANGQAITVQYFQYVRLEYHPDSSNPAQSIQITPLGQQEAAQLAPTANLKPETLQSLTSQANVRIASLMFHYVRIVDPAKDKLGYGLSVTPANFVKYLDWLQTNGYHTVTVSQIYDSLKYGISLPEKSVSIRFDDGHSDQWFAYQEMHKRGMTATFFVITHRLELTPQQWQQIDRDGFEVAAHTRTHAELTVLSQTGLENEITGSKQDLEAMLGHPVRSFAYPYGDYNNLAEKVVQNSGFEVAVSTNGGFIWSLDKALLEPTIEVIGSDNVQSFAAKVETNVH